MMNIPVKIKKLHPAAVIPAYAKPGDAGFDLVAIEDVLIRPGETAKIRTGLAMAIPAGYEVQIRPRSGVSSKTKLRVILGTIDSGYKDEIGILIDNVALAGDPENRVTDISGKPVELLGENNSCISGTYLIRKGDRLAQGVLSEIPRASFEEVDELPGYDRGGGFGSTGTR